MPTITLRGKTFEMPRNLVSVNFPKYLLLTLLEQLYVLFE